jgi:hypothetical protein
MALTMLAEVEFSMFFCLMVTSCAVSSLTGNVLDDTRENPIPYKYESGPRPDCTIQLFTDKIVFDALQ